jgi:hypothetical protein
MSDGTELIHYGILGQKWGIRRYQNEDGTLTDAGKKRYASLENASEKYSGKIEKSQAKISKMTDTDYKRRKTAKLTYKQEKLEEKQSRYKARAQRAQSRMMYQAVQPNWLDRRAINKNTKYQYKIDRVVRKLEKYDAKVAKENYKIEKYSQRINRIESKMRDLKVSEI